MAVRFQNSQRPFGRGGRRDDGERILQRGRASLSQHAGVFW